MGRIELHGNQAVVEIPDGWEARLVKAFDGRQFGDRRVRAWTSGPPTAGRSGENHFSRLARLLELEGHAEAQRAAEQAQRLSPEEAQQTGNSLLDLVVVDEEAGLGGRYLIHLGRTRPRTATLDAAKCWQSGNAFAAGGQGRTTASRRGLRT